MSFFNRNATRRMAEARATGPATGFMENISAAFSSGEATELLVSENRMINEAVAERRARIEEITGQSYDDAIAPYLPDPSSELGMALAERDEAPPGQGRTETLAEAEAIERLRETLPPDKAGLILGNDRIPLRAQELALERVLENEDIAARGRVAGVVGQFLGAMGAQFTDPLVLATLPFGPASGARLPVAAAINGALAGGVTAAQQPTVQKWRERLGLPAGFVEAAANVGMATVGGAGLTAGLMGLAKGIGYGVSAMRPRQAVEAFDDLVKNPTPEQIVARDQLDAEARFEEANPFTPENATVRAAADAEAEHASRAVRVAEAMDNDQPLPRFPEDGPEPTPLIDRTMDFEAYADPLGPAARGQTEELREVFRQRILTEGDSFKVWLGDDDLKGTPGWKILADFDDEDDFLREIARCL